VTIRRKRRTATNGMVKMLLSLRGVSSKGCSFSRETALPYREQKYSRDRTAKAPAIAYHKNAMPNPLFPWDMSPLKYFHSNRTCESTKIVQDIYLDAPAPVEFRIAVNEKRSKSTTANDKDNAHNSRKHIPNGF